MEINALHRLRAAQGVLASAPTNTATPRLEAACARAIAVGDPTYRTIKGILAAGTEHGDDLTGPRRTPGRRRILRGPDAFDTERTA